MTVEILELLSMIFGILSLFFFSAAIVIWIGLHVFHDISVLTGLGQRKALRKMRSKNNIRRKERKALTGKDTTINIAKTTILPKREIEETVILK